MESLGTALFLMLPVAVSGVVHMVVVRHDWLARLATPIHESAFGSNKTWRGFVVMPAAALPGLYLARSVQTALGLELAVDLADAPLAQLGLALGTAYLLAELPNSFVKRRLGIQPGRPARRHRAWFALVDQADSAVGCTVAYMCFFTLPAPVIVSLFALGPAVHLLFNVVLFTLGLRKEPV